jgi:TRAP-type C4-dicarboxylate transport system permease small subunit
MPIKTALQNTGKGIRFIENALVFLCGIIFMLLMFLGTADVIGRTIFNKPITGTFEISEIMMGAIVLLGWAYTQKQGEHVSVDLVYDKFPAKIKTIVSIIVTLVVLALFVIIMIKSWTIAYESVQVGRQFVILHFPSGPFYFLVPVGTFFMCLELIIQLSGLVSELRKK